MTPDDVRMTAQLVVDKRVHCVSDEAVEAMARRVLELEQHETALAQSLDQMVELAEEAQSQRNSNHQKAAEEATLRARAEADLAEAVVALDVVRAVGVTVERREDGTGWAVTNTRAVEAEAAEREACAKMADEYNEPLLAKNIRARGAAQGHIGSGDPVVWEPVSDDVVLAVCVHYRDELVKAFESAPDAATWRDVIEGVRMLNKPVRTRGAR